MKKTTQSRSDGAQIERTLSSLRRLNGNNVETKTKIHINPHPMTVSEVSFLLRTTSCSYCDVNANKTLMADASSSSAHPPLTIAEADIDTISGTTEDGRLLWPTDEAVARRRFRLSYPLSTVAHQADEIFRCHSRTDASLAGCSSHQAPLTPSTPSSLTLSSFFNETKNLTSVNQVDVATEAMNFTLFEVGLCIANDSII